MSLVHLLELLGTIEYNPQQSTTQNAGMVYLKLYHELTMFRLPTFLITMTASHTKQILQAQTFETTWRSDYAYPFGSEVDSSLGENPLAIKISSSLPDKQRSQVSC